MLVGALTRGRSITWIKRLEIAEDAAKGSLQAIECSFEAENSFFSKKIELNLVVLVLFQGLSTFIPAVFRPLFIEI